MKPVLARGIALPLLGRKLDHRPTVVRKLSKGQWRVKRLKWIA
jgi:hypothetical protein